MTAPPVPIDAGTLDSDALKKTTRGQVGKRSFALRLLSLKTTKVTKNDAARRGLLPSLLPTGTNSLTYLGLNSLRER